MPESTSRPTPIDPGTYHEEPKQTKVHSLFKDYPLLKSKFKTCVFRQSCSLLLAAAFHKVVQVALHSIDDLLFFFLGALQSLPLASQHATMPAKKPRETKMQ